MSVIGLGIDIQEVDRLRNLYPDLDPGSLKRIFLKSEIDQCMAREDPYQFLAGRFSAKEAVIKSLRISKNEGIVLDSIEILNAEDGAPYCILHGPLKDRMESIGGISIMISISHTETSAAAVAVCIG